MSITRSKLCDGHFTYKPTKPLFMNTETLPSDPARVRAFASFFKNYMSVSTVVAASLPLPISYWKLIPIYEGHRSILMTYTPLFCFLTLGYIFYSRHAIARNAFLKTAPWLRTFI